MRIEILLPIGIRQKASQPGFDFTHARLETLQFRTHPRHRSDPAYGLLQTFVDLSL